MNISSDEKVQKFLEDIQAVDTQKHAILQAAREVIFQLSSGATERFIYGGIMFSLEQDFAGLFAYKQHVSLVFGQGYLLEDPNGMLEGGGKYRRHLKLGSLSDIKAKKADIFVNQSIQLATQK